MLSSGRKPGLPRLTKQNMEDAPEDQKWVESIRNTVNVTADELDRLRAKAAGIKLLENADVEQHEIEVEVGDPWINLTLAGTWAPQGTGDAAYAKHPNGLVEVRLDVNGGGATTVATLPVGYRPDRNCIFWMFDSTGAAASYATVNSSGVIAAASTNRHIGRFIFLASDSTPVPMSCWPKFVKTKLKAVSSVFIGGVYDGSTSVALPAGAVHSPVWETTTIDGAINVKITNIAGLPYNRKSRIRLLIVGG